MSSKFIAVSWVISAVSVICVLIQNHSINRASEILEQNRHIRQDLEEYVVASFQGSIDEYQIIDMCDAYINDSKMAIYLPVGLCRACFSSLVFTLQDIAFPFEDITVICDDRDIEVQSECISRGMNNILLEISDSPIKDIVIIKRGKDGRPVSMRYNLGDEYILNIFLSNLN